MKNSKSALFVFVLLVIACSLYRVWDGRPLGFAPQIAMALFAGSVISNKKFAFLFPLLSMLLSDGIYQILHSQGLTDIQGFYSGQWENYLLIAAVTFIGFIVNKRNWLSILAGSIGGALFYFVASNFLVWIGGGLDINNQPYPKTMTGLVECYSAALIFLKGSLYATVLFSGAFFGLYQLSGFTRTEQATA